MQTDADSKGTGDACNDAEDADGDERADSLDNCPNTPNPDQANFDADFLRDACDDSDGDGVNDDGDGLGNGLEGLLGTDPLDSNDPPPATPVAYGPQSAPHLAAT